jgi:L-threonylcarbamoyladenylate synthase
MDAVAALQSGLPVLLPTDTVYGLASAPGEEPARRLYELKGRSRAQPTAVLAATIEAMLDAVPELDRDLLRKLLPGPFTLVVPNPAGRYRWLTGERADTIGVRVPELPAPAEAVLSQAGLVMATSANVPGGPDPARLDDVPDKILEGCGAVIDAGELPGVPSTVIDLAGDEPRVLRQGAVSEAEALKRVTGLVAE